MVVDLETGHGSMKGCHVGTLRIQAFWDSKRKIPFSASAPPGLHPLDSLRPKRSTLKADWLVVEPPYVPSAFEFELWYRLLLYTLRAIFQRGFGNKPFACTNHCEDALTSLPQIHFSCIRLAQPLGNAQDAFVQNLNTSTLCGKPKPFSPRLRRSLAWSLAN